jgi:hypothetical protein
MGLVVDEIGHVAGADEGAGEDGFEAERKAVVLPSFVSIGRDVFRDASIAASGLEILADGDDVNVGAAEIAEKGVDLVFGFTEANHEAGFGERGGTVALREGEHVEGLLVEGLGADGTVEAGDGLHVVIEDMGLSVEDAGDGGGVAAEVGCEDFDLGFRESGAYLTDGFGEMGGSAVGEFIAIDAGDDDVAEAHGGGHAGDVGGFGRIGRGFVAALGDGTEGATPGTDVAEDHEGSCAAVEALVDIGAAGGLADGVEVVAAEFVLEGLNGVEVSPGLAEEIGKARARPDGDERVHVRAVEVLLSIFAGTACRCRVS